MRTENTILPELLQLLYAFFNLIPRLLILSRSSVDLFRSLFWGTFLDVLGIFVNHFSTWCLLDDVMFVHDFDGMYVINHEYNVSIDRHYSPLINTHIGLIISGE